MLYGCLTVPIEARVFPVLCLEKFSPLRHAGEIVYTKEPLLVHRSKSGICCGKKTGGEIFAFKATAMLECRYSPLAKLAFLILFSMWSAPDAPLYLPANDGGFGYLDFKQDEFKIWCAEKWPRVARACKELVGVLRIEKVGRGVWRAVFLLERCDRRLYDDEKSRIYGSAYEYLKLHDRYLLDETLRRLKDVESGAD